MHISGSRANVSAQYADYKLKDMIKQYKKLIDAKKADEAKKMLPLLQKAIDKSLKGGVIKGNNAARKKSRLMKKLATK